MPHAQLGNATSELQTWEYPYSRALVLFLQGAPANIILSIFQADCESQGITWWSSAGQQLAVDWFLTNEVARTYPVRRRMLRSLLKHYISAIEQRRVTEYALMDAPSEDPVQLELIEAFISLGGSGEERETDLCFKAFYNPFVAAAMPAGANTNLLTPGRRNGSNRPHATTPSTQSPMAISSAASLHVSIASGAESPKTPNSSSPLSGSHTLPHESEPLKCDTATPVSTSFFLQSPVPKGVSGPRCNDDAALQTFCAVRVASGQFSNVGLAVWPAAFVLVQLLAQELEGESHILSRFLGLPEETARLKRDGDTAASSAALPAPQLNILELGAGVGLTPVYLHRMASYRRCVSTFLATDYQEQIVENIRFNLRQNNIAVVEDFVAAKHGLEGDVKPPYHGAILMDWTHAAENEALLMRGSVDVCLAADCIYDLEVVPALAETLRLVLTVEDASTFMDIYMRRSSAAGQRDGRKKASAQAPPVMKRRCCVVVQTHRQNSTMKCFFDAVRPFAEVQSYVLSRQPAASFRVSKDGCGKDGGCIPLGGWWREGGVVSNPDRVVSALVPDVVLEDGSLQSMSDKDSISSKGAGGATSMPLPRHRGGSDPLARLNLIGRGKEMTGLGMSGVPNSSFGSTGSASWTLNSSMETADALLADAIVGPFFTPMAGIIGVHVLTLKATK